MVLAVIGSIVIPFINASFIHVPTPPPSLSTVIFPTHLYSSTTMFSFCLSFVSVIAYSSYFVEYTVSFNDFVFDFIPLALLYKMFSLLFVVCFYIISYWWKSVVKLCVIDFCIICFVDFFCKICLIRFSI